MLNVLPLRDMHIYLFICHSQHFTLYLKSRVKRKKESQNFPLPINCGKTRVAELMAGSQTNVSLLFPAVVSDALLHITPQSYRSNTFLLLLLQ